MRRWAPQHHFRPLARRLRLSRLPFSSRVHPQEPSYPHGQAAYARHTRVYRSAIRLDTYIGTDNLDHSVYRARIYRRPAVRSSFFTDCRFSRQLKRARRCRYPRRPLGFVVAESTADRLVRGCSLHRSLPLAACSPSRGRTSGYTRAHARAYAPGVPSSRVPFEGRFGS